MLTFERANELFHYEPSSGRLIWKKVTTNAVKVGDEAGTFCKTTGYIQVYVDGHGYTANRIAMILTYGDLPKGAQIDHINHDRSDNRLENLRITDREGNGRNVSMMCTNTTGVMVVVYHKKCNKYMAQIYVDKKHKYLGIYETLEEAATVRKSAEFLYGYHPNHGK